MAGFVHILPKIGFISLFIGILAFMNMFYYYLSILLNVFIIFIVVYYICGQLWQRISPWGLIKYYLLIHISLHSMS